MYTAKDMYQTIKESKSEKGKLVDSWLQEVVLPTKLQSYQPAFDCPKGISLKEIKVLLELRGFSVKTWQDHQGSFVDVKIPPQGD